MVVGFFHYQRELPMFNIRLRLRTRYLIWVIFIVVFYIEIVTYSILPFQWMNQPICKPPKCSKLLLVADPQIIGSQIQGFTVLNYLAKWDSDRYIRRTFAQAFHYLKPEMVIFLGDMMDEGHISSDEEFFDDYKRFMKIFKLSSSMNSVPIIYLPGDNDIGGIDDIMFPDIVHRFNENFNQSVQPVLLNFIEMYKINFMTYEIQEPNYVDPNDIDNNIRVVLSHVPLLRSPTQFLRRVVKRIRPHIIFSGHDHLSLHFLASEADTWNRKYTSILPNDTETKIYNIRTGLIHEIVVPTCSYRMGVKYMGFGAAFIDTENKLLHYNVLWLPRRFVQLSVYLVLVIILFFSIFVFIFIRLLRKFFSFIFTHRHI